jgi:hypothetical protein
MAYWRAAGSCAWWTSQERDGGGGQQAAAPGGLGQFGHGEPRHLAQAGLGEQRPVLPGDLGDDLVGHPVEHGDERDVVLLGGAQQVPGDGVGVARGRGDHHPDVGGADQLGGEGAVLGDEGVDVGRVEEGEARRQCLDGLDAQGARGIVLRGQRVVAGEAAPGVLPGHPHAGEAGQHARVAEPVAVLRMAHQHRRPGRRPQHARLAHASSHQGIDERGFPRAGRSPHHGQQGGLGLLEPGHQVVVELGEQFVAVGTRARGPLQGQGEACGGDAVAQGGECFEQLRPYVQGHHMRRMPNFMGFLKHMSTSARRQDIRDGRDDWDAGTVQA